MWLYGPGLVDMTLSPPTFVIQPVGETLVDLAAQRYGEREHELGQVFVDDRPDVVLAELDGPGRGRAFKAFVVYEVEPGDENDDD